MSDPVPHDPRTLDDLTALIQSKVTADHGYESSADALWETALATFNYVAGELGVTGWQAGFAAMKLLVRINGWDGPVAVIRGEDMVYPQYDIPGKVAGYMEEWRPWASERARELLATSNPDHVAQSVWEHWERLAMHAPPVDSG